MTRAEAGDSSSGPRPGNYVRFVAMIATSMVAMFVLTYVTTYELDQVRWSETRFYT